MRKLLMICLSICPLLLFGQVTPLVSPKITMPKSSNVQPQTSHPQDIQSSPKAALPRNSRLQAQMPLSQDIYTSPGVATLQGNQWVGAENLYHLSPDIGIVVEIIKPADLTITLSESMLKEKISGILRNSGLFPRVTLFKDKTPLPFFHLILMVNPVEKGYFAYCSARLFEQVNVSRVFMKSDFIWQAITWEKQELLLFPTEQLQQQIDSVIQSLTMAFGEKYRMQNMEAQRSR